MSVRIISYTAHDKMSRTGWAAMFYFDCKCGQIHQSNAHGLWPDGKTFVSDAYVKCPVTGEEFSIQIEKPEEVR